MVRGVLGAGWNGAGREVALWMQKEAGCVTGLQAQQEVKWATRDA